MAFLEDQDEIKKLYEESVDERRVWQSDYTEYERLMDNGLMAGLDPNLPEVNDGSLAASLFKLPKRLINRELSGKVTTLDRDEDWIAELANLVWKKDIQPHANTQAPFIRKWKDSIRKAAGYGGVPLITLYVEKDEYCYADFIVAQPQDVTLEKGKVSDSDCDVIFWDVYYTDLQLKDMIKQAQADQKEDAQDSADKEEVDKANEKASDEPDEMDQWDIPALKNILKRKQKEGRTSADTPRDQQGKPKPEGYRFVIVFQRGVNAPFYMWYPDTNQIVRTWSNPDPCGEVPVNYLYCYQDFINPYGIGIVKLAGGTQNVLDYMRQADVLATQIGIRPPIAVEGQEEDVDVDSLVYAQDAIWFTGDAKVVRQELADGVYTQLPNRIAMYKTSLNQLIPVGDTSISTSAGDPQYSKTPAGVNFQQASLSIDDEDFKDNLYITYGSVVKSMINTHFANMEGTDILRLDDDEKKILSDNGFKFVDPNGQPIDTNQIEIQWDTVRAKFDFEVDPSSGKKMDEAEQFQRIQEAVTTITPQVSWYMGQAGYKFNIGAAYYALFSKMDLPNIGDIIEKMTQEEAQAAQSEPFPIIDPPTIRLNGQIPGSAMAAALQSGGVQVDPNNLNTVQDQIDLGDVLKDPGTTALEKAQIKQLAGIQPDPNAINQPPVDPNAPVPPSEDPANLALKNKELDIKQQDANTRSQATQLDAAKVALEAKHMDHQHTMDIIKEVAMPGPTDPRPYGANPASNRR